MDRQGLRPHFNAREMTQAMSRARSAFDPVVAQLERTVFSRPVQPAEVQHALRQLLAPLSGLRPADLPALLLPEVNLIPAGRGLEIPLVQGLDIASGLTRKPKFHAMAWQVQLHQESLSDPGRIGRRLAGLAVDVAFRIAAFIRERPEPAGHHSSRPDAKRAGVYLENAMQTLDEVRAAAEGIRAVSRSSPRRAVPVRGRHRLRISASTGRC